MRPGWSAGLSMREFHFPSPLYPIVDTLGDPERSAVGLAEAMMAAGVRFLQLRIKDQPTRRFVELARAIQDRATACRALLIINDRADIASLVGAAGVHLGQEDLLPADARVLLGPEKIVGFSTHNLAQAERAAAEGVADYLGFGPIYATTSKLKPDPVQGLEGLRRIRARVAMPIVAIGGITRETTPAVLAAGADAVAVIGDIVRAPDVRARIAEFLQRASARG
jgi:thiamine-phosphate pyrophosphorylase